MVTATPKSKRMVFELLLAEPESSALAMTRASQAWPSLFIRRIQVLSIFQPPHDAAAHLVDRIGIVIGPGIESVHLLLQKSLARLKNCDRFAQQPHRASEPDQGGNHEGLGDAPRALVILSTTPHVCL